MTDTDTDTKRDADGTSSGEAFDEEVGLEELDAAVAAEARSADPPAGEAERASATGAGRAPGAADRSSEGDGGAGAEPERASSGAGPAEGEGSPDHTICTVGFCPIGMTLTTMEKARPDAVQHLLLAGREFLLAAKAVIDARADEVARDGGLQKIDVG